MPTKPQMNADRTVSNDLLLLVGKTNKNNEL
jgi:hypothetical protein